MNTTSSPHAFHPGRHLEILDDPVHDPYQERGKLAGSAVCTSCGAVYQEGRWKWTAPPDGAERIRCAACRRIEEKLPAGYVTIDGAFARSRGEELVSLARNLERREKAEHPMKRIIDIDEDDDRILITTTDIHLARAIGEALRDAYQGTLDYHYNKDEYLLRVQWRH